MGDVVYVSEVRVEREDGPVRRAHLPAEEQPVFYGTHGPVAAHYGHAPGQFPEHATTLDHVVGAAVGWLTGTFAGALAARRIDPTGLVGEGRGEIELEGNVLVIKRIDVQYSGVMVPADKRDAAERALATHQQACPVARSIEAAIAITTAWAAPSTA